MAEESLPLYLKKFGNQLISWKRI